MINLNKVKKILSFEFSIIWIGRQSFYRPFQGVENYEPGCAGSDQRTFSHGCVVSRHDAGCRRWRQTACDLQLQPRTQLSGNHPAGSRHTSAFPLTSPDETCPPQKQSPTRPGRRTVVKRRLSLLQHGVTVVVAGRELSTSVGQIWMRREEITTPKTRRAVTRSARGIRGSTG